MSMHAYVCCLCCVFVALISGVVFLVYMLFLHLHTRLSTCLGLVAYFYIVTCLLHSTLVIVLALFYTVLCMHVLLNV